MSLRDEILGLDDRQVIAIEVPEWDRTLHMRPLSGMEADLVYAGNPASDIVAQRLLALSLCDEHGDRIFGIDDGKALVQKGMVVVGRLMERAMVINRLATGAIDDAKKA